MSLRGIARHLTVASWLVVASAASAHAQLDCVAPSRERIGAPPRAFEGDPPDLQAFRRLARRVEAVVTGNAAFAAGFRPTRLRTTIDYGDTRPRTAVIDTVAYPQEVWAPSGCDILPEADHGPGIADGTVRIVINDPRAVLGPSTSDGVLETFAAPAVTDHVGGVPVYGGAILISRDGVEPWVVVTIGELLDREARRLDARRGELAAERDRPGTSDAEIDRTYQQLKSIDAKAAEVQRAIQRKARDEDKQSRARLAAAGEADLARRVEALARYRASFSDERLRDAASVLVDGDGTLRVDASGGKRLVRLDPSLATREPDAVHFLVVSMSAAAEGGEPARAAWLARARASLDLGALAAVVE